MVPFVSKIFKVKSLAKNIGKLAGNGMALKGTMLASVFEL
jgi:hypothetical protein